MDHVDVLGVSSPQVSPKDPTKSGRLANLSSSGRGLHTNLLPLDTVDAARSAYDRSGIVAWTVR